MSEVNIILDAHRFTDAVGLLEIRKLYEYAKERSISLEVQDFYMYIPKSATLTSAERKLHKRSKITAFDEAPRIRRGGGENKHEELFAALRERYNCIERIRTDGYVILSTIGTKPEVVIGVTYDDDSLQLNFQGLSGKLVVDKEALAKTGGYEIKRSNHDDKQPHAVTFSTAVFNIAGDMNHFATTLYADSMEDIADNYRANLNEDTKSLLESIKANEHVGKTIILHGEPGTGKSYWIKAFSRELRKTYYPIIVPQSESFFHNVTCYYSTVETFEDEERLLFIFEDAGRLFRKDARESIGQAVSTMLNITDGLIGKGREDLFLFTFNERIDELDEAVARPGRCVGNLYFEKFSREEACVWLEANGVKCDLEKDKEYTLADLYNVLIKFSKVETKKRKENVKLGFM